MRTKIILLSNKTHLKNKPKILYMYTMENERIIFVYKHYGSVPAIQGKQLQGKKPNLLYLMFI